MVWLFLPETLKAKKHNPPIMTNDDDITSSNSMVTSDDDLKDEENQRLLRLPRHKKMLVCDKQFFNVFNVYKYHCSYSKVNKLKQLLRKAWYKVVPLTNLIKDRRVLLTSTLYGLLAFAVIISDLVIHIDQEIT